MAIVRNKGEYFDNKTLFPLIAPTDGSANNTQEFDWILARVYWPTRLASPSSPALSSYPTSSHNYRVTATATDRARKSARATVCMTLSLNRSSAYPKTWAAVTSRGDSRNRGHSNPFGSPGSPPEKGTPRSDGDMKHSSTHAHHCLMH